uniref:NADH dehydrogenase subunit 6 n=1 Tax=Coraebus diminutus TaxID=1857261 RepID=UPI00207AD473|nr:NADH dehydrogenase subunit 6 [Coraebus diminutus]URN73086.1 NADH dehydrogenase subunit 6 [Coraebus diminutus]
MMLMSISIYITTVFLILKHPISMGIALLMQSASIALITGMLNINFWYSYIMFLIMVGGMLVLFIYMTSVASNEKFNMSKPVIILALPFIFTMYYFLMENQMELSSSLTVKQNIWELSLNKFFNFPHNIVMVFLMTYLFITLIAVVKITKIEYGPLRTGY